MMVVTDAIQNLIRENKVYRIDSSIQTGRKHGMFLLDDSLFNLWKNGTVEKEEILMRSNKPQDLSSKINAYEKGAVADDDDYEDMDDEDDDNDDEEERPRRRR